MFRRGRTVAILLGLLAGPGFSQGSRLSHLGTHDPYYPGRGFARLETSQWVGEEGVEAVAILSIDDLRAPEPYEAFLRPVLERLKEIEGRAPVSVMVNALAPGHPQVAAWIAEGLSIETHTEAHPCPLLAGNDLAAARATYERCIDQVRAAAGIAPVAFRMPCCDSIDSVSPRFFEQIFERTTPSGAFLAVDSSVFQLFTPDEPALPRELVLDAHGEERFRPYLPADRSFANWIEDYPYPYVIGRETWEFPCVVPSDWEGQHRFGPNDPRTLADLEAALDLTVAARGVFTLVCHPHGWIRSDQLVALVDHAAERHAGTLRFLTFREALARVEKNLLAGSSLRKSDGSWNGVVLLDLDGDRYQDVVIANERTLLTRRWLPSERRFVETDFPLPLVEQDGGGEWVESGARFGVAADGHAWLLASDEHGSRAWRFDGERWVEAPERVRGLATDGEPVLTRRDGHDAGVRLRDLDGDGECELVDAGTPRSSVFHWLADEQRWETLSFALPAGISICDEAGRDAGARFVDLDDDGQEDLVSSNESGSSVHCFGSLASGWSRPGPRAEAGDPARLPMIAERGEEAGAWFHSRALWVQNEHTASLPDHVEWRSFRELLAGVDLGPRTSELARRALHAPPGFQVELAACEPVVEDPIAFDWDAHGRLFVVEMGDYPTGERGSGRVKLLEDADRDGRYERASLFLDGLSFPTGVTPYRDGVLVTCAPDIFFARDTDGDGVADEREVLYTGFVEGNPQHRVNGLWWGLDGWYWGANGDSGGEIVSTKTGERVDIDGRDFRIHPDSGRIEAVTGMTQFGRTRDDWGNWFGGNNSEPFRHYQLEERYLARTPLATLPEPRVDVARVSGAAPVFPLSRQEARFNDLWALDRFTSACSPMIYRDELLGTAYAGNIFVCEPVHNLVHREVLRRSGASFTSERASGEQRSEFVASSDPWFRPTMVRAGPDGALWIADMARAVIEHPEWIPDDWEARIDLYAGSDLGRIWRVVPIGRQPRPFHDLAALPGKDLVAELASDSGWVRDTAQRLLVERGDPAILQDVTDLELAHQEERPVVELHALWLIEALGRTSTPSLAWALDDPEPGVRVNALRIAEAHFGDDPVLGREAAKLVSDPDPAVRFQLACSLGFTHESGALATILKESAGDPLLRAAASTSLVPGLLAPVARELAWRPSEVDDGLARTLLSLAVRRRDAKALRALVAVLTQEAAGGRCALWGVVLEEAERSELDHDALVDLLGEHGRQELRAVTDRARKVANGEDEPEDALAESLALLGREPAMRDEDLVLIQGLLAPSVPASIARAALAALDRMDPSGIAELLLERLATLAPEARTDALAALMHRPERARVLLHAIESGAPTPGEIAPGFRTQLLALEDPEDRELAQRIFAGGPSQDRASVIERYARELVGINGRAEDGRARFAERCATCHRVAGTGQQIGADLGALPDLSDDYLLAAVLDPNRAVEARYLSYTLATTRGEILGGLITEESSQSVTLVDAQGVAHVVLRAEIESLRASGLSHMPVGLESDLSPQDLADVFAFLRDARADPAVPGSTPGEIVLWARDARLEGSLVFEPEHQNIGWWGNLADRATWTATIGTQSSYEILLDYACDGSAAGNTLLVELGEQSLTGEIESTRGWEDYRLVSLGRVELPAGPCMLTARAAAPVRGYLLDLRSIRLRSPDRR
jgi:putative membrane-bound dehydrogenase-like protein